MGVTKRSTKGREVVPMSQACKICTHPQSREIDRAILHSESNRRIATRFKLIEGSVRRHKDTHLAERLASVLKKLEECNELILPSDLAAIYLDVRSVADAAKEILLNKKTGKMSLRKRGAMPAANKLLKAVSTLRRMECSRLDSSLPRN